MAFWRNPHNPAFIRAKVAIARVLLSRRAAALATLKSSGIIRTRGLVVDTRSPEVTDPTRAALLWGFYESAERRLIAQHLRPTRNLIDLGASLGVVSSEAARLLTPGSAVTCVEANAEIANLAQRNVGTNAPHVRLRVVVAAIDYDTPVGQMVTLSRGESHIASSVSRLEEGTSTFSAPAIRLSSLVGDSTSFTLIMDIEGSEAGLLVEEREVLAACTQMVVELHEGRYKGRTWTPTQLLELLIDMGFSVQGSYGNSHVLVRHP